MSERGQLVARFEVSARDQRTLAYVRGVCAVLGMSGAAAMMLGKLPVPIFMVALLAMVVSLAWLAQARRLHREAAARVPASLLVYSAGFALQEAGRNDWLPWSDLVRIEVDEERLDVRVARADGSTLRIEPKYAGVDIHQLVRTLEDARAAAHDSRGHPDS